MVLLCQTIPIYLTLGLGAALHFCLKEVIWALCIQKIWAWGGEVGVAVMLRAPAFSQSYDCTRLHRFVYRFAHADWFSVKHNDVDEAVVECWVVGADWTVFTGNKRRAWNNPVWKALGFSSAPDFALLGGWLMTNNSTSKSRPQSGCITYFWHCHHLLTDALCR